MYLFILMQIKHYLWKTKHDPLITKHEERKSIYTSPDEVPEELKKPQNADIYYSSVINLERGMDRNDRKLIEQELPEQVLVDGGNFELSPMYHAIFLDDLLDLFNIHHAFDRNLPNGLKERIPLMMNWLDAMCHPDGEISFFNDASLGVVPISGVRTLFFALFGEESTRHKLKNESHRLLDLSDSGYSRVDIGNAVALIDRAPIGPDYLPGHAHADTFSFDSCSLRKTLMEA